MDPNSEHSEMIKNNVISFPFRIVNIAILGPIMEEILTKKSFLIRYVNEQMSTLLA